MYFKKKNIENWKDVHFLQTFSNNQQLIIKKKTENDLIQFSLSRVSLQIFSVQLYMI